MRRSSHAFSHGRARCGRRRTTRVFGKRGERAVIMAALRRLNEPLLHMRNTRKTLIIAVLLAELAVGAYLVFHKGDESTETHAAPDGSTLEEESDPGLSDTHVTAGSIAGTASAGSEGVVANAPTQSTQPTIANIASEPAAPIASIAPPPQPATKPNPPPAQTLDAANPRSPSTPARSPAQTARADITRDSTRSHNPKPATSVVTDELVRESAKLDPALPPPAPLVHDDPSRRRTNPVAAAMTDSLVRDSARLDPSLPPPKRPGTQ